MNFKRFIIAATCLSCMLAMPVEAKKYLESFAPEETGMNVMKLTDEGKGSCLGHGSSSFFSRWLKLSFASSIRGACKNDKFNWGTSPLLCVSPDGTEIAYITRANKQDNVMIRRSQGQGSATQRTFRDVTGACWGKDGTIYFADASDGTHSQICSTNAHAGTLMKQHTNNNWDSQPAISPDGKILYFVRSDKSGSAIWSINLENGALTSCARGYNPCPIGNKNDSFLCTRNSTNGNSEIWLVNYIVGQETCILSDKNRGFSNPQISPDGQWVLVQGSAKSSINKEKNLDVFAVKIDGSTLVQLTYHPGNDCCPMWSPDGKFVYFISSRANKDDSYNVWRINFKVE